MITRGTRPGDPVEGDSTQYAVGDTITYRDNGNELRTGVVVTKYDEIKNGRPGFDIDEEDGATGWGYDEQITSVQSRRPGGLR